jgi:hypothetical protein
MHYVYGLQYGPALNKEAEGYATELMDGRKSVDVTEFRDLYDQFRV